MAIKRRTKIPPPSVFRYQQFMNDVVEDENDICSLCKREISCGVHDLKMNIIYCYECADDNGIWV